MAVAEPTVVHETGDKALKAGALGFIQRRHRRRLDGAGVRAATSSPPTASRTANGGRSPPSVRPA
jgi:hypothetical protein